MSRLYEWKLMNPQVNNNNNSSNMSNTIVGSSSAVDYKGKLKKLFDYHMSSVRKNVDSCGITHLNEDPHQIDLGYEEIMTRTTGNAIKKEIDIKYNKDTSDWHLKVAPNKNIGGFYNKSGKTFNALIDALRSYLVGPLKGSAEDQEILEELSIYKEFKEYENLWSDEQ